MTIKEKLLKIGASPAEFYSIQCKALTDLLSGHPAQLPGQEPDHAEGQAQRDQLREDPLSHLGQLGPDAGGHHLHEHRGN